jgi:hypothetical protein
MGPSHPSNVEGEKDHYLFLARAFMPLSTPLSEELVEVTEVDGKDGFSLRQALLVLIRECCIRSHETKCVKIPIPVRSCSCVQGTLSQKKAR